MQKRILDIVPPREDKEELEERITVKEQEETDIKENIKESHRVKTSFPKISFSKWLLLAPVLTGLGLAVYFLLGEVRVEIWPELSPLSLQAKVSVDKNARTVNFSQKIIPGFIIDVATTVSREFPATGRQTIEKKSEGVIKVYNNSSVSQVLVQNTRFQAPLEKFQPALDKNENPWFKTSERITIPAKSSKDVRAAADGAGEKYNIKPSKFSVPGLAGSPQYTLVYGESFQPFSGGEKKEVSRVVSQDLEKAKESLIQQAKDQSRSFLQVSKVPSHYFLLADALKTETKSAVSSVKEGTVGEKFLYDVTVETSALTFKGEDLKSLAQELMVFQISQGEVIDKESLVIDRSVFSSERDLSKIVVSLGLAANSYKPLEETLLKEGLAGRPLGEAKLFLEKQDGIQKIKIKLWPFWKTSIPKDAKKIKLEVMLTK